MSLRSALGQYAVMLLIAVIGSVHPLRGAPCATSNSPGATLLIPYFEVDLDDPGGRDTIFSVNNAEIDPVLAHVVLWTDLGVPSLAFDVYLEAHGVQSLSLRRIVAEGRIPASQDEQVPLLFPGCSSPLSVPELDAAALAELRARHTGRPAPSDGLCYGAPRSDPSLAVGYVTVDAVRSCSEDVVYPSDPGYFGSSGLTSPRNALWGDVMLLDPRGNSAQGFAAVATRAEADASFPTFWGDFSNAEDDRLPLGVRSRSRFFDGGTFEGGTDVLIWQQGLTPQHETAPFACDSIPEQVDLTFRFTNEAGEVLAEHTESEARLTARRTIGGDLPAPSPFGFVEVSGVRLVGLQIIPFYDPVQLLVVPMMSSTERFSVGLANTELSGSCPESSDAPRSRALGYTSSGPLYEVDLDRGTYRMLNDPITGRAYIDLTTTDDGRLFGMVFGDPGRLLITVDPLTGDEAFVGEAPNGAVSMAFGPGGDLWVVAGSELHRVDPASGRTRETLLLGEELVEVLARDDQLYGWSQDGFDYHLLRIDPASGELEPVVTVDLDGAVLVDSDFDLDGNVRILGRSGPTMSDDFQRFYRVVLNRPPGVAVRAEVTVEELFNRHERKPRFDELAMYRSATRRPRAGGARPAASLLVPYFEVDLERREGRNTLFSVNNAGEETVLANVVVWTDWGIPSVGFPVVLESGAGRVFDLRRLFVDGSLPSLGSGAVELYPGCATFQGPAVIDSSDLAAQHTGRPRPSDGLCYGSPREDVALAVGYVTVDVVRDCSAAIRSPMDEGYFGADGLAAADNVLWGEVFLIEDESDFAQGFSAVPVPADPDLPAGSPSFYSRSDDRLALGCQPRSRYFESGVFDGGTELLLWSGRSPVGGKPILCGSRPVCQIALNVSSRGEDGGILTGMTKLTSDRVTQRLAVGGESLPVSKRFGSLDVRSLQVRRCGEPHSFLVSGQTWAMPLMSARGRFSVALEAVDLGGTCR